MKFTEKDITNIRQKRKKCIVCESLVLRLQGHGLCSNCYRNEYIRYSNEKKQGKTNLTFSNWRRKKIGLSVSVLEDIPDGKNKGMKVKKTKKRTDSQKWIDKLDSVFSVFVRLRDTDKKGFGLSIDDGRQIWYFLDITGKVITNCDNGHYIGRGNYNTRWDEKNCNAQSIATNRFREGLKVEYRAGIVSKYGEEAAQRLDNLQHQINKRKSVFEMQELYKYYASKVSEMLSNKEWYTNQRAANTLYK